MLLKEIQHILREAYLLTHHTEYVIIGSSSVYGSTLTPPKEMISSYDLDLYPKLDPGRASEIADHLGENTAFEKAHKYYADAVSPKLSTLPEGWETRLQKVVFHEAKVIAYFLNPHDAAISKYTRLETRDREWIRAGLRAGILNIDVLERYASPLMTNYHMDEDVKVRNAIAEDRKWLDSIKIKSKFKR